MSCNRDLTLDEALADPMIRAAREADRVDPRHFETLLRSTARRLDTGRGPAARATASLAARGGRRPAAGDLCAW